MDPEEMIGDLNTLADRVAALAHNVRTQIRIVSGQWERLGKVGGQRADHAAELMAQLFEPLLEIHTFTGDVRHQIQAMRNDPFGS
jgi:thiamine pyrophosphokinase